MSSLKAVGRSAAARKNDRVSLCSFTFSDGPRCRTPRTGKNPHFCFYHAQKEARARAQAAEKLGKDLAYFFSGDYLSACDLSTALARLIPAVIRGDIKPRLARTVAYMCQTLMQSIHVSQKEYANAYGTEGWRKAVRNSVHTNYDYLCPPDPDDDNVDNDEHEPQQRQPLQSQPAQPQQPAQAPPQSPAGLSAPTSSTGAARLQPAASATVTQTTAPPNAHPSRPQQSASTTPQPRNASRPSPATVEAALSVAREMFPARPSSTPPQSAPPTAPPQPMQN